MLLASLLGGALVLPQSADAQSRLYNRLVTTDPGDEYDPTISADGRWLVYTGENAGAPGLFMIDLRSTRNQRPQPIFPHPAATTQPVFSPMKNALAFTSQRDDALGDVFVVNFPDGKPVRLTERGRIDKNPIFSRDGLIIKYDSGLTGEVLETRTIDWKKGVAATSDALPEDPVTPYPVLAFDATRRAALLYADDTNRDGTFGPGDSASAWERDGARWVQVSPPLRDARSIARHPHTGHLYVAARWLDSIDIGVVDRTLLNTPEQTRILLNSAVIEQTRNRYDSDLAISLIHAAYLAAESPEEKLEAALAYSRVLNRRGRYWQADRLVTSLLDEFPDEDGRRIRAQGQIARFELGQERLRENPFEFLPSEDIEGQMRSLMESFEASGNDEDAAEMHLALARLGFVQKNYLLAARESEVILEKFKERISSDLLTRALLFRSDLFAAMGLGSETGKSLISIFAVEGANADVREAASSQLIAITTRDHDDDATIQGLRLLASQGAEYPWLVARVRRAEGRALAEEGSWDEAVKAYTDAIALADRAPLPAAEAALDFAELYALRDNRGAAIKVLTQVSETLAVSDPNRETLLSQRIHRALVDQYLKKGRRELALRDPMLALSTFRALIAVDPTIVDAWRSSIEALSANPVLLGDARREYQQLARRDSKNAVAHYRYALILTYPAKDQKGKEIDADFKAALRSIDKALSWDVTVPQYYLLKGFILEQLYDIRRRAGRNEFQYLEDASQLYEQGIALVDRQQDVQLYADLLLNSANVALALNQAFKANDLYKKREATGVPHGLIQRELFFHWRSGTAAYQASDPRRSVESFQKALQLLPRLAEADTAEEVILSTRLELMGRQALALMELNRLSEADANFAEVVRLSPPLRMPRVKALRNRALLQERQARTSSPANRIGLLTAARTYAEEALALLANPELEPDPSFGRSTGLFDISLAFTSDNTGGGARLDFDKSDEERLLRATLARIARLDSNTEEAVVQVRRQLELDPTLDDGNRAYFQSIRAVTLSRLAWDMRDLGESQQAVDQAQDALRQTRFIIQELETINVPAATILLGQIAEHLRGGGALDRSAGTWWMLREGEIPPAGMEGDWLLLDRAAQALLANDDPAYPEGGTPLVVNAVQRARLHFVRAQANEALFHLELARPGERIDGIASARRALAAGVRSSEALSHLKTMEKLAEISDERREIHRLVLLASVLPVRINLTLGDGEAATAAVTSARTFAEQTGQTHLNWWLRLPFILSNVSMEAVDSLLSDLEQTDLLLLHREESAPWELLDLVEQRAMALPDGVYTWDVADRFRRTRLRFLAEESGAEGRTPAERRWLEEHSAFRARIVSTCNELLGLPLSATYARDLAQRRLGQHRTAFQKHLLAAQDPDTGFARLANYMNPPSLSQEELEFALLSPPFLTPWEPSLLLNRVIGDARRTAIATETAAQDLSDEAVPAVGTNPFVLGEESSFIPEKAIYTLSSSSLFRNFLEISLSTGGNVLVYPGADREEAAAALPYARALRLETPLLARGPLPAAWRLEGSDKLLGDLLTNASALERIELTIARPVEGNTLEFERQRLALASWLERMGIVEARINELEWIGLSLDPRAMPELAESEIAVARGALIDALGEAKNVSAIRAVQRMIILKEALGIADVPLAEQEEPLVIDYQNLSRLLVREGRYSAAADAAARSVELLRKDAGTTADQLADALILLGNTATRSRRWDVALPAYDEAARVYAGLADKALQLDAMLRKADALEIAGRYQDALALARELEPQALAVDKAVSLTVALRSGRLLLRTLNRYAEAEALFQRVYTEAEVASLPALQFEALVYMARVCQATARFADAEEYLDRAKLFGTGTVEIAQILLEEANINWLRSEYYEAFSSEQQIILLLSKVDRTNQTPTERNLHDQLRIATYNLSGLTSWAVNDLERAELELQRALEIAMAIPLESEIASTWNNLGLIRRSAAKYKEAAEAFNTALEIDRAQENTWGEAYSLRNLGITMVLEGRAAEAIAPLTRAVTLTQEIGDRVNECKALLARADAHAQLADSAQAAADYAAALGLAQSLPIPEIEWRTQFGLGRLSLASGDSQSALDFYAQAIDVVDRLRASIRVEEFQNGFLLDKQELYDAMVSLLLDLGQTEAALENSEKSRGRNFIDLLGNRRLNLARIDDQNAVEQESRLRLEIERLERAVPIAFPEELAQLTEELARARQAYSDFLIILRTKDPQLASFLSVEPVSVAELQALLEPETRMIVYHVLQSETIAWVVSTDRVTVHRMPIAMEELMKRVQQARVDIQSFGDLGNDLAALSQTLLVPFAEELRGAKRLCIVPHRELHTLPFAALMIAPGEYVIDRHGLFYTPSASVLRYTMARRSEDLGSSRVLGLGNPDRGSSAYELPFAEKEAERLQFDFDNVTIRTGSEATESWLVDNLQDYGVIHIASHGEYNADLPLFSAVLLAPDEVNDGTLSAQEIFSLQLRADLISLSACQTGLGRVSNGDDIVGLNRAFVYAGTRQMLTTLWRVDDISTAVLFKHFYRNAAQHDRAEALRRAQIRMKSRPDFSHPARWAGLVLSGDWQ